MFLNSHLQWQLQSYCFYSFKQYKTQENSCFIRQPPFYDVLIFFLLFGILSDQKNLSSLFFSAKRRSWNPIDQSTPTPFIFMATYEHLYRFQFNFFFTQNVFCKL